MYERPDLWVVVKLVDSRIVVLFGVGQIRCKATDQESWLSG